MAHRPLPLRRRVRANEREQMLEVVAVHRLRAEAQLEPVVLGRVVRAGNLDAADHGQVVQAPVQHRRWYDSDIHDTHAGGCQSLHQGIAQLVAARPVVAPDSDLARDAALQHQGGVRTADGPRGLDGEVSVHDAPNVILAKDSGGDRHQVSARLVRPAWRWFLPRAVVRVPSQLQGTTYDSLVFSTRRVSAVNASAPPPASGQSSRRPLAQ